jgi:MFS family permease
MPAARRLFLTVFLDLIGFGIVLPLLPSYGARYTSSAALIGALVATDSLLTFLLAPAWGRLSDRIGRRPVLLIGLAGSVLSYVIFGLAGSFLALVLSRVVSGATGATIHVAQAYLADVTPPERRSHAMGLIGAAFGLGFTVGPAIGGSASATGMRCRDSSRRRLPGSTWSWPGSGSPRRRSAGGPTTVPCPCTGRGSARPSA